MSVILSHQSLIIVTIGSLSQDQDDTNIVELHAKQTFIVASLVSGHPWNGFSLNPYGLWEAGLHLPT